MTQPIVTNLDNGAPTIVLRAYQLWEAAGRPSGKDEEFYFAAEEELRELIELKSLPDDKPL